MPAGKVRVTHPPAGNFVIGNNRLRHVFKRLFQHRRAVRVVGKHSAPFMRRHVRGQHKHAIELKRRNRRLHQSDMFDMHRIERSAENARSHCPFLLLVPSYVFAAFYTLYRIFRNFSSLYARFSGKNILMKNYMKKSAEISHVFFTFSFSFFLFLCFFRYLRLSVVLSVLFALAAACCAAALLAALLGRKRRKSLFSLRAEKEKKRAGAVSFRRFRKRRRAVFQNGFPRAFFRPAVRSPFRRRKFILRAPAAASRNGRKKRRRLFFLFLRKTFRHGKKRNAVARPRQRVRVFRAATGRK